jgi:hypothetical protein
MVEENKKLEKELAAEVGIGDLMINLLVVRMIEEVTLQYLEIQ